MAKASDLIVECLEQEGVEHVFGVPGEENLDFLDSLSRSKTIRLILTRHEQGAGFMAATYGRHTGRRPGSASPPWVRARPISSPPPPTRNWAECRC
jgi:thiamine pyrophosphate-dependent acetolactate synthase large subunit-like protein